MSLFQLKKLSEIRRLLPSGSETAKSYDYNQAQDFNAYKKELLKQIEALKDMPGFSDVSWDEVQKELDNAGEYTMADEWALLLDAAATPAWTVQDIDLDNPWNSLDAHKPDPAPRIHTICINGHLKARNIYNENTDGATGLIVLGNLEANNIVAGGQEIYVTGNLHVKGLFWGDYNHGELVAQGAIEATVFISTDYRFDYRRFENNDRVQVPHFFWDERREGFNRDRLAALFHPDCLAPEGRLTGADELYSWKEWLAVSGIIERLKAGQPLLRN